MRQHKNEFRLLTVLLTASVLALAPMTCLGKSPDKTNTDSTSGNTTGGNPGTPQNSNGVTTGTTVANTNGGSTLPIESTIFAYKALSQDAEDIAKGIAGTVTGKKVIVTSQMDIGNIVLWRTVMAQLKILTKRANDLDQVVPPTYDGMAPAASNPPVTPLSRLLQQRGLSVGSVAGAIPGVTTALSDVTSLVQTIASLFAVHQTVTPFSANLTDAPLLHSLASRLYSHGAGSLAVPAIYAPGLVQQQADSPLLKGIEDLETIRTRLLGRVAGLAVPLKAAQATIDDSSASPDKKRKAQAFVTAANEYDDSVTALSAQIDTFETTLFTGAPPAQPNSAKTDSTGKGQSPAPDAAQGQGQTPPAQTGGPGTTQQTQAPAPQPSGGPTPLQQIIGADLLMGRIGSQTPDFILIAKVLESGGTQLGIADIKGDHVQFSGGSVVTFGLYGLDGTLACSGTVSGYFGFKAVGDVGKSIGRENPDTHEQIPNNRPASDADIVCAPNR
jgi:hypothetical protein